MTQTNTAGLLDRKVPVLNPKQLEEIKRERLFTVDTGKFDPTAAIAALKNKAGQHVLSVDIGGNKLDGKSYTVNTAGKLVADGRYSVLEKDRNGAGYISALEKSFHFAQKNNLSLGVSLGVPLDGSRPKDIKKLPVMINELKDKYAGDFANLFPDHAVCLNDAPAGLISASVQANLVYDVEIRNVIYVINGGGLGAAVLKNGKIIDTEAGHGSRVIPELNLYGETRECGVLGGTHICFEDVASNERGIEEIWKRKRGESISAVEIEKRYTEGRPEGELSLELYDYSALMVAHFVKGLANAFEIELNDPSTTVVCHGGAFKFPGYGNRIKQILAANGENAQLMMTKDYSDNACAEGAAIAALTM